MHVRAGLGILIGTALLATVAVVATHTSESVGFYETINGVAEVDPKEFQQMWDEGMQGSNEDTVFAQTKPEPTPKQELRAQYQRKSTALEASVAQLQGEVASEQKQEHQAAHKSTALQQSVSQLRRELATEEAEVQNQQQVTKPVTKPVTKLQVVPKAIKHLAGEQVKKQVKKVTKRSIAHLNQHLAKLYRGTFGRSVSTTVPEHVETGPKKVAVKMQVSESGLDAQMQRAAAAVAVAQQLLNADGQKASALINKAEVSGSVADKEAAAEAVNQSRRLSANLYAAKKTLDAAKYKLAHLPVSAQARAAEKSRKKKETKIEAEEEKARRAQQKAYEKQYGVKSTCKRQCGNEKRCQSTTCTPNYRQGCVKYSGERCVPKPKCAKYAKRCAKVTGCIERAAEAECSYPRKCVKEEKVCEMKNVCIKKAKDCTQSSNKVCAACATKVKSCREAHSTAKKCTGDCVKKCAGDSNCEEDCHGGCQKMYQGFLASCKVACPSCGSTSHECKTKCLQRLQRKKCGMQCKKWVVSGTKSCHRPCLKKGLVETCNEDFCSEYTTHKKKACDSVCLERGTLAAGKDCQCTQWSKIRTETCSDKCKHNKCTPECSPTFHSQCVQRGPVRCHRPKRCSVKTFKKCTTRRGCAKRGPNTCRYKKKCIAHENQCHAVTKCAEHETKCADDFSTACTTCASRSLTCVSARKNSVTCLGKCQKECMGNKLCQQQCRVGCESIQRGLLSSCREKCPACAKKVSTCQSTCKRTKIIDECKKVCVKEVTLPDQVCFHPCAKMGTFKHCDANFCPKYTYGKHVCDKPCVRFEASTTKWCKPKCEAVHCKKLCTHQPVKSCIRMEQHCKTSKCVKRGLLCDEKKQCVIPGKRKCTQQTKCLHYSKKCVKTTACVKKVTRCAPDTAACTVCRRKNAACGDKESGSCVGACKLKCGTDAVCLEQCAAGCDSITQGFKKACAAACPTCAAPAQVCREVCTKEEEQRKCSRSCTKKVQVGPLLCTQGPCRMMGRSKQCDPNACLKRRPLKKPICKERCGEFSSELQKVCTTDCSKDPADTFDQYKRQQDSEKEKKSHVDHCQKECYAAKVSCPSNKISTCEKEFHTDVTQCISSCHSSVLAQAAIDPYGSCMSKCDKQHPLAGINKCRKAKCAGLEGAEGSKCEKQCYEDRGRCRCACDAEKEYVCHGYNCECRTHDAAALEAAKAVAGAAESTADGISGQKHPLSIHHDSEGAQSVAEAAIKEAAKYGARRDAAAKRKSERKAAAAEAHKAMKLAQKERRQLKKLMRQGANKAALSVAQKFTNSAADVQRRETLVAATAAAKDISASSVQEMVRLAALAASKAAKLHSEEGHVNADVTAAAKAAVKAVMQPIMKMITTSAQEATDAALVAYPSRAQLALSEAAKKDISVQAAVAAEAEAKLMVTTEDKNTLLADVEKAAADATRPKVLGYVKELAAKAALQGRSSAQAQGIEKAKVIAVAKDAAGRVAQAALDTSKSIIESVAKEAVEAAITDAASVRIGQGATTEKAIAANVKHALDGARSKGEKAAKAAAKAAIMKEVHRASSAASNEAAAKGKTKQSQADAADKAASDAIKKGRGVQQVVKGITTQKALAPSVDVKVSPSVTPMTSKPSEKVATSAAQSEEGTGTNVAGAEGAAIAPTAGTLVLEAIEKKHRKKTVSHLEHRLQTVAKAAAQAAALKVAKLGKVEAKDAALKAAKLAAKSAVLAEVRSAARIAARRAKDVLKDKDLKSQASAASAAASQTAQHVLAIANRIVNQVAMKAAGKVLLKHH